MENLKIKKGETFYLLYNLSVQSVHEFKTDPQKLSTYANNCLQTGLNICVLINEQNPETLTADGMQYSSASSTSTSLNNAPLTTIGTKTFSFLCGNIEGEPLIIAVKFANYQWHYFDELDSQRSMHDALPSSIDHFIRGLIKTTAIEINLSEEQSDNYFSKGQFAFKNKKLKTHVELTNDESENQPSASKSSHKSLDRSTRRLVFVSGETNPLLFLNQFEKSNDVKTDKDKMYKIRDFVDECHKAEFSKLYLTGGDWSTVKSAFLKLYSTSFTRNKKRELNINFNETPSLRSFVERKLINYSKFTTLPLINQMEIIMNDLPTEISNLFITNEKMTCDKAEILDFCESIQDFADNCSETTEENGNEDDGPSSSLNKMEIFNFSRETDSSENKSMSVDEARRASRGRGRGRGGGRGRGRGRGKSVIVGGVNKRGRRPNKLKPIREDSSEYDFLSQVSDSTRSTWSDAK